MCTPVCASICHAILSSLWVGGMGDDDDDGGGGAGTEEMMAVMREVAPSPHTHISGALLSRYHLCYAYTK